MAVILVIMPLAVMVVHLLLGHIVQLLAVMARIEIIVIAVAMVAHLLVVI